MFPNRHLFCKFIPWPQSAAPQTIVAEVPLGGTEADSEEERVEDSEQGHPRHVNQVQFYGAKLSVA